MSPGLDAADLPSPADGGSTTQRLEGALDAQRHSPREGVDGELTDSEVRLLDEALATLDLMERGALAESKQRIQALAAASPGQRGVKVVQTLLERRLEELRRRLAAASTPPPSALPAEDIERARARKERVTHLKKEGLRLYSQGDLKEALTHWQRILALDPDDVETRQFLRRTMSILENRPAVDREGPGS